MNCPQVYVASTLRNQAPPAIVARDRLDVPVWVDPSVNVHFALAGDILRSWMIPGVVPASELLFVISSDPKISPRPLGTAIGMQTNTNNADPATANSRERVYLEAPSEPGSVGQCCLVFHGMSTTQGQDSANIAVCLPGQTSRMAMTPVALAKMRQTMGKVQPSPVFPPTPLQSGPPRISALRGGLDAMHEAVGSSASLPASLPSDNSSPTERMPNTPQTADAISSLALMLSLSRKSIIGIPDFDEGYAEVHRPAAADAV